MICKLCRESCTTTKHDKYCRPCRKILNDRRKAPEVIKARQDSYYWSVTVPRLRAKFTQEWLKESRGKPGVYRPLVLAGPEDSAYNGMVYKRSPGNWSEDKRDD